MLAKNIIVVHNISTNPAASIKFETSEKFVADFTVQLCKTRVEEYANNDDDTHRPLRLSCLLLVVISQFLCRHHRHLDSSLGSFQ